MAYINGRLHEVESWDGKSEALPPAPDYVLLIEAAKQGTSSKKGSPQLEITTVVQNEGELHGRKGVFFYNLQLDKDTPRKRLRSLVDACGVPMDANGGIDDQALIGKMFMADVIAESYKDVDVVSNQTIEKTRTRLQSERKVGSAPTAVAPVPTPASPAKFPAPGRGAPVLTPTRS